MFAQLLVNGLIQGSNIVIIALGFSLIYAVCGVFHFAHGAIYTLAAYLVYQFFTMLGINFVVSIVIAFIICILIGMACELLIYRPLRRKGVDRILMVIVSLGIMMIIQAIISIKWGTNVLHFQEPVPPAVIYRMGLVSISQTRIITFVTCLGLFAITYFYFLRHNTNGIAMRALISNPDMARVVGVNKDRIILLTFILGSALAVPGSILLGYEDGFVPSAGFNIIMYAFIAMMVGGIGSIPGTLCGGLLMGVVASLSHLKLGGQWESAIVFGVLLLFIVLKPTGIFGNKVAKSEI